MAGQLEFPFIVGRLYSTTRLIICRGHCHPTLSISRLSPVSSASGFIIPRKFNSTRKKKADKLLKNKRKITKDLQAAREAAIEYFVHADAVAAEEAAAVEVAAIEAVDVAVDEPVDDVAVASVIGIADQNSRPRLPDFVPPPTLRRVFYRPYDRSPSPIEEPPTPPGHPESEEDDFIPNLSDCEVRSEVGPSSEDEAPEPTLPPPPSPPSPPRRLVRVRNVKTNKIRCIGLDQLFRPEPQDRIVRRK